MLTMILTGFIAAMLAPFVHKWLPRISGYLLALVPAAMFAYLFPLISKVASGETILVQHSWFPSMGINVNFLIDGLSLTFALIVSGIGAIIMFYASGYLHEHPKQARFYGYLLFFMTSMLGLVLSDNILALFIFWELTSISSYLLIGFNHETEKSRYAALQALIITAGGGLALMAGLILLGNVTGSYNLSEMMDAGPMLVNHSLFIPIAILIFAGAFTKSAQFPFHFWLPNAMEAPTPVSAYLHSATMVKAGVFLLARLNPLFSGTELWHITLTSFGGVTMLMGAAMAVGQTDLKRILAYTTISALGIMVFLIGLGGKYAITAAMTFLVVHAMYKGALFLVAGAIDHETGTRDIRKLGGLRALMPLIFAGSVMAALSYAGIPPFLGFISKELVYEATASLQLNHILLTSLAVITNMFLVATALMAGVMPFTGKYIETPKQPHHTPVSLWIGPVLLGLLGLLLGAFPAWISKSLILPTVNAVGMMEGVKLALWHGLTLILLLSFLTLAGGAGIFLITGKIRQQQAFFDQLAKFGPEEGYKWLLEGLINFSARLTNFFQNGYLRNYFYWILSTFMILVLVTIYKNDLVAGLQLSFKGIYFYEALVVMIMLMAVYTAITSKTVLSSVASVGVVGYGAALIFSFFSAPDLALTQFSIETLTVILLVFIVYKVPRFNQISSVRHRRFDALLSIAAGVTMTVIVFLVLQSPAENKISTYFLENSYIMAHGRNVVNVILVDFRALDTMGEIVVITLAAIGVYTLLRFRSRKDRETTP